MKNVHILFKQVLLIVSLCFLSFQLIAQTQDIQKRLQGFDEYMDKILKDWNAPGVGVGVVVKDKLVFSKGYGYRDYEKKLPITSNTLFQIASNTKLFTSIAVGFLVDEKKLEWDRPVKELVPSIQFYNDELNNTVTIRDMLAHRTGISRHDMIWYKSDFSRRQLFDRLKYLEPSQSLRQGFLYNNMMYASSGYIIELLSGKTWEDFVRERIFTPLQMKNSYYTIKDMERQSDYGVPYNEKRDTTILYRIPFYEEAEGVGPAGSIISNIEDISHWLIALMNDGKYEGKLVIPSSVIKATLAPAIALPNTQLENRGYGEMLNSVYGMGRWTASYRGHLLAYHGGDIDGFHSQISCMPYDSIGVVVFVLGDHPAALYNIITYNIYERMLGLDQTPWSERRLPDRLKAKQAGKEGRAKAGAGKIADTKSSHPVADYGGQFEHPAYGILKITEKEDKLQFDLHGIQLPLNHYHYDRFDTPNDERYGTWSVNFLTSPQGEIDRAVISLDESEATFVRKPDETLIEPKTLKQYIGKFELAATNVEVSLSDNSLFITIPGQPRYQLVPKKPHVFGMKEFSDLIIEFILENGKVTAFKQIDPSGEFRFDKKK